jgi:hypothetical protein
VDIEGALSAGCQPIVYQPRRALPLPLILPDATTASLRTGLDTCIGTLPIDHAIAKSLLGISLFTKTMQHAELNRLILDPYQLAEEFWAHQYDLLKTGPLRLLHQDDDYNDKDEKSYSNRYPTVAVGSPQPMVQHWEEDQNSTDSSPFSTTSLGADPSDLQPAQHDIFAPLRNSRRTIEAFNLCLRIALLLYVREPIAGLIHGRTSYPGVLRLLREPMEVLFRWISDAVSQEETSPRHEVPDCFEEGDLKYDEAKPFLVWITLLGYLYSVRMSVYMAPLGEDHTALYVRMLRVMLGTNMDVVGQCDLLLCGLVDMRYVTGPDWDARETLRRILSAPTEHVGVIGHMSVTFQ